MVKLNLKYLTTVMVVLVLGVYAAFHFAFGHNDGEYSWKYLLGDISKTISVVAIVASGFVTFAWKWRMFKGWLVQIPDLNGSWKGPLLSSYTEPPMRIATQVVIKQTFLRTTITLRTGESTSLNLVASYDIDKDRGIKRLIYTYQNDPKATVRYRSEIHYGTVILNISEDNNKLEGHYWTTRKTIGDITLNREKSK